MIFTPRVRKLALTAHLTSSLSWFGAVAAFLALALVGMTSQDTVAIRSAYVSMHAITWFVIVPLCFASLVTGVVLSLGTSWGLFRHYWVVTKLVLTLMATAALLIHTQPIRYMADAAAGAALGQADHRGLRLQLTVDAAAALAVLLVIAVLGVYKPRGLTRYGWRKQNEARRP